MDGKDAVSRDRLLESLKLEIAQTLAGVAAAVNNAPEGRIISGSVSEYRLPADL